MKRCPKCNKMYSDLIQMCPDCNISLSDSDSSSQNNFGGYKKYPQNDSSTGQMNNNSYFQQNNNSTTSSSGSSPSMGFLDAIKTCFSKYANFSGRARRSEYWWFFLFNVIMSNVLSLLASITGGLLIILYYVYSFGSLLPGLAVSVRRLHDVGKKWTYLLIILIPIYGLIKMIITFAQDSDPGENAFGPCPK